MAATLCPASPGWALRRAAQRCAAPDRGRRDRRDCSPDPGNDTARCDALVTALNGSGGGPCPFDGALPLEGVLPATTPQRHLQALDRPAVCRKSAGHFWPLHATARARHGAVRRRDIGTGGSRLPPAHARDAAGAGGAAEPRLYPPRHIIAVRGS